MKGCLLNQKHVQDLLVKDRIVLIDGGARGKLFSPFNRVDKKILHVFRFEPDGKAPVYNEEGNTVISKALWSKTGKIHINIAVEPSTSSVYPFNRPLQKLLDPFFHVRQTRETVEVDSISLDDLLSRAEIPKIDFIKLDIHGAEYEVLLGAHNVLKANLGLLVESWLAPIHLGQKTRPYVESLLYENKFYAFEEFPRSEWTRMPGQFTKKQLVAVETLYFKDPTLDNETFGLPDAIKLIGIADLFGHHAYALQLTQHFYEHKVLDELWNSLISTHIRTYGRPTILDKIKTRLETSARFRLSSTTFK